MKNRWQDYLTDLPKLVNRVDNCLMEGEALSYDLEVLINPKSRQTSATKANSSSSAFGLSLAQMAAQPQSIYPLCNEQSVRAGVDHIRSQVDCLARDKGLLQEQVSLVQSRIDHTGDISQ